MTLLAVLVFTFGQAEPAPTPEVDVEARQAIPERWLQVADCESDRRWHIDALHDGGLQFHPGTWVEFAPEAFPDYAWQASPIQQVQVAERVLEVQGPGAWPNCGGPLT